MLKVFIHIALLIITIRVAGQDKLEADRPGETRSPELVKGKHFQGEAGFRREKLSENNYLVQHPVATLRYGLFNALEFRMEVTSQTIKNEFDKQSINGLKPVKFGLKAKILPEYKGFPNVGVMAQVGIPSFSSNDYYNRRLPIEFRTLFGNTLSKKIKLQYNAGLSWEGDNRRAGWTYSVSPVFELSEKINLFVEEYAFLKKGISAEHYVDAGFDFYLHRNFMLDISGGLGLSENSSPYFFAAGFSFRLPVNGKTNE